MKEKIYDQKTICELQKNLIFSLSHAAKTTYSLYVAFEMGLFNVIKDNGSVDVYTLCRLLGISDRSGQALLSMCASVGLLECDANAYYNLSESTRCFLLPESEFYLGDLMNLHLLNKDTIFSYDAFKQAVITGSPQIYEGRDLFAVNAEEDERTIAFTKAMHAKSTAAGLFWPKVLSLADKATFLDIGGGSGAHSIQATLHWPHLKAIVYDMPLVCQIAEQFIAKNSLGNRITTQAGNMWTDELPNADVHFYCDILHDWPINKLQMLMKKSYDSLPENGHVIIHELLFDDNKSGPLDVSMYNMSMLMWTQGQQLSQQEVINLLTAVGFKNITFAYTGFGHWSIATGTKHY